MKTNTLLIKLIYIHLFINKLTTKMVFNACTKYLTSFLIIYYIGIVQIKAQNVTLTDNGSSVVLNNGIVSATITKNIGQITSYMYKGFQLVTGNIYFSMDGGSTYSNPGHCIYSIKTNTPDLIDLSFNSIWTNDNARHQIFDIDIHFVMKSGLSGVYVYAILKHPSNYAASGFGEWRMVWKLNQDQTEWICVDSLRNWQMPNSYDYAHDQPTSIAEVVKLTTGVRAGLYDCKYEFSTEYWNTPPYGHASNVNNIGVWAIFSGHEFFNDGPTKQDLSAASGIIHIHFGMNHYNGSTTSVAAGEQWSKIFGPYLLYANSSPNGVAGCWADAKVRASTESAAWPYSWLTNTPDYPLADGRGSVSGKFVIKDTLKPDIKGADAWIGVTQLSDSNGNWQFESKKYEYWVKSDANGLYTIPNVRPGTYKLYAFTNGETGEISRDSVTVSAGKTTALSDFVWKIPRNYGGLAWEIGIPNRSATEFKHGNDYFQPFMWNNFAGEMPNPIEYNVTDKNWSTVWNYVQCPYPVNDTTRAPWKWRINFNLDKLPVSNARLTLAFASSDHSNVYVYVNNETSLFTHFYPDNGGGDALIREGIHAKYGVTYIDIPPSRLVTGKNTITVMMASTQAISNHVMYDYLSLEVPGIYAKATSPFPSNGAINIDTTSVIASWQGGAGTTSYRIYLGTDTNNLVLLNTELAAADTFISLRGNTKYYWRIDEINNGGTTSGDVWSFTTKKGISTGVLQIKEIPLSIFPNPFNKNLTVQLSLPNEENVTIEICDLSGRIINSLTKGKLAEGTHLFTWNPANVIDLHLSSGIYLLVLKTSKGTQIQKVSYLKE